MAPSLARAQPELDFEFAFASELPPESRRSRAEPSIVAAEKKITQPLRRRAVLPAEAAAGLESGALPEPRTTT